MNLETLKPFPEFIIVRGAEYELKEFTLRTMSEVIKVYGSIDVFRERVQSSNYKDGITDAKYLDNISSVFWLMLKDQDDFPSKCKFKELAMQPSTNSPGESFVGYQFNINQLFKVISRSNPIITESESVDHLDKKNKLTEPIKPTETNFTKLWVLFSSNITITLDQFYDLTLRQIIAGEKEILIAKREKIKLLAKLNGVPIIENSSMQFSKEEDEEFKEVGDKLFKKMTVEALKDGNN